MTANCSEEAPDKAPFSLSTAGRHHRASLASIGQIDWAEIGDYMLEGWCVEFANPREEEFARTLEAHRVAWRYKPRTFAVEWDEEGNFVDSFTPDFYLPEYDQYVELDTADQSLTEKNRGLRLLRRHQPTIKIELVSGSEYEELIERCTSMGQRQYSTR
jgi:hypothetical protein